jgi:hypothetical protein
MLPPADEETGHREGRMRIDFYYYADCPSHEQALERLREEMRSAGVEAEIAVIEVVDEEQARALRFIGSPTIRVDGVDIDPTAGRHTDYGLSCRAYTRPDGRITPLPPRELIQAALAGAGR